MVRVLNMISFCRTDFRWHGGLWEENPTGRMAEQAEGLSGKQAAGKRRAKERESYGNFKMRTYM